MEVKAYLTKTGPFSPLIKRSCRSGVALLRCYYLRREERVDGWMNARTAGQEGSLISRAEWNRRSLRVLNQLFQKCKKPEY